MSNFKIKQIHPNKKSRVYSLKHKLLSYFPFLKGFLAGLFIAFSITMTFWANDSVLTTRMFFSSLSSVNTTGVIYAKEEPIDDSEDVTDISDMVIELFGENASEAYAVFKAESGLKAHAKGWNCHYYDAHGARYSAACKKEDRHKAWSVDCGIAQNNFIGQECPSYSLEPAWSVKEAYRKFKTRGFSPWVAWKKGLHLPFMGDLKNVQSK